MTKRLLAILLLLWLTATLAAPAATAQPDAGPTADAGTRIAITFVSDVRDNGEATWFDALGRPRTQAKTPLAEPLGAAALWSSTLVYTAEAPTRLIATFTTGGSFARCTIFIDDQVRATNTVTTRGGRAACTA